MMVLQARLQIGNFSQLALITAMTNYIYIRKYTALLLKAFDDLPYDKGMPQIQLSSSDEEIITCLKQTE